jgi:hypothetical protein
MRPVRESIVVRGRAFEAETLWYDRTRWASWIDGFGHVLSLDPEWPATGATLKWNSRPGGAGLTLEKVVRYEPRLGQTLEIEDAKFTGTRRVIFEPGLDETKITLEVSLEPKAGLAPWARLLLRRRLGDSLRRTLSRFSVELAAEKQFGRPQPRKR